MKNIYTILFGTVILLFGCANVWGQNQPQVKAESEEYQQLKMSGSLGNYEVLPHSFGKKETKKWSPQPKKGKKKPVYGVVPKASGCDCYIAPDSTYTLALPPDDDGSSPAITLPFTFSLYGITTNTIYINNNGNVTLNNPLATFSPTAFPSAPHRIIAPFWADVDTRGGNGQVLYKITPTAIYINWEEVGYYNMQGDKRNTFQLILTDGADPAIDGGNVAFCYQDMQWTTGSASGGVNGFGGVPATAGTNKGDNATHFLLARFDHPGTDFDGALGNPDGISWLDYKSFFLDIYNGNNIPPVPNGLSSCDTVRLCSIGDTADYPLIFLSPESNQITNITVNAGSFPNITTLYNNAGNTATTVIRVWGDTAHVDTFNITVTATDNFSPPGVTNLTFTLIIDSSGTSNFNPVIDPFTGCDSVEVGVLNGPYDSYLWSDITQDSTTWVDSTTMNFSVTVSKNGCYKKVSQDIMIGEKFLLNLQGSLELCPGQNDTYVFFPDSLNFGPITWNLPNPAQDTVYSNILGPGTYQVSVSDTLGYCTMDTTFSVSNFPALQASPDDSLCANSGVISVAGGSGSGTWSLTPNSQFSVISNPNSLNPSVTFPTTGVYEFVFTDDECSAKDTVRLVVSKPFVAQYSGTTFYCPDDPGAYIFVQDSARFGSITWGNNGSFDGNFSNFLPQGNYQLYLIDTLGLCQGGQNFVVTTQAPVNLGNDTLLCDTTLTMVNNTGPSTGGMWSVISGPGNVIFQDSTQLNQLLEFTVYGTYTLVYTDNVCGDDDTLVVQYLDAPDINLNNPVFFHCPGGSVFVQIVDSANLQSASWGLPNAAQDTLFANYLTAGTYTLSIQTPNGCVNDTTFTITTQAPTVLEDLPLICGDTAIYFSNTGVPGGTWSKVSGPGSVQFFPPDSLNPKVAFGAIGTYVLKYSDPICNNTDSSVVKVQFYPYGDIADFVGCLGKSHEFVVFDPNNNLQSYAWSNGNTGPASVYLEEGVHFVIVGNECGQYTIEFEFTTPVCDINMPNVFTPNPDGINSFFLPIQANPGSFPVYNMKIFNRWGNKLFESNEVLKGWDGYTESGKLADDGVYFYVVRATTLSGDEIEKQGFFHLMNE